MITGLWIDMFYIFTYVHANTYTKMYLLVFSFLCSVRSYWVSWGVKDNFWITANKTIELHVYTNMKASINNPLVSLLAWHLDSNLCLAENKWRNNLDCAIMLHTYHKTCECMKGRKLCEFWGSIVSNNESISRIWKHDSWRADDLWNYVS